MSKGKASASTKAVAGSNYERNRQRRLARHLKNHPSDLQSAKAEGNLSYRRKTPKTKNGWANKTFASVPMDFRKTIVGKHALTAYARVLKVISKVENDLKYIQKELRGRPQKKKK